MRHEYDTVFVLMAPSWIIAAWPILRVLKKQSVLWYAVWKKTFRLKVATLFANRIVASVPESFPIRTEKLVAVGQGIDTDLFKPDPAKRMDGRILSLGRLSKIKKVENIVRFLKDVEGVKLDLDIVGGPVNKGDEMYVEQLERQVHAFHLENRVHFLGRMPHDKILEFYQRSDIFINLTPTGSFDKTMLEAMASGCLLLTANQAFKSDFIGPLEPLLLERPDYDTLMAGFNYIQSLSDFEKEVIREKLRSIVVARHSLDVMIPKLAEALRV